jgi:hypothetical protein
VQDRPSEGPISPSAPDPQRASVRCGERRVDRFLQARCGGHFGARGRGGAHLRMGAVGRCHLVRLRAWCVPFCGAGDVEIPRDLSVTRSSGPRRPVPCWSQGCRLCLERCPHRTVSSGNLVPSGTGVQGEPAGRQRAFGPGATPLLLRIRHSALGWGDRSCSANPRPRDGRGCGWSQAEPASSGADDAGCRLAERPTPCGVGTARLTRKQTRPLSGGRASV